MLSSGCSADDPIALISSLDVFFRIASLCDDRTLRKLSGVSLWPLVSICASNSHWWFLRTQHLVQLQLSSDPSADWKHIYQILHAFLLNARGRTLPLAYLNTSEVVVLDILRQLGRLKHTPEELAHQACENDDTDTVCTLIRRGLDLADNDFELVITAARAGHKQVFDLLLSYPEIRDNLDQWRYTAATDAAESGQEEIVTTLVTGADPELIADCLTCAVSHGWPELTRTLVALPGVIVTNELMETACNASDYTEELVRILLSCPLSDPTRMCITALMFAAEHQSDKIAAHVLSRTDITLTSDTLIGACELCVDHGSSKVASLLVRDTRLNIFDLSNESWFEYFIMTVFENRDLERDAGLAEIEKLRLGL